MGEESEIQSTRIQIAYVGSEARVWKRQSPEVSVPAICEQSVNMGADKKAEGFALCFLLVTIGAHTSSPNSL